MCGASLHPLLDSMFDYGEQLVELGGGATDLSVTLKNCNTFLVAVLVVTYESIFCYLGGTSESSFMEYWTSFITWD